MGFEVGHDRGEGCGIALFHDPRMGQGLSSSKTLVLVAGSEFLDEVAGFRTNSRPLLVGQKELSSTVVGLELIDGSGGEGRGPG